MGYGSECYCSDHAEGMAYILCRATVQEGNS